MNTTIIPKIHIESYGNKQYAVWFDNVNLLLPVEINTSSGTKSYVISKKRLRLTSKTNPIVDPKHWLLTDITYK